MYQTSFDNWIRTCVAGGRFLFAILHLPSGIFASFAASATLALATFAVIASHSAFASHSTFEALASAFLLLTRSLRQLLPTMQRSEAV